MGCDIEKSGEFNRAKDYIIEYEMVKLLPY